MRDSDTSRLLVASAALAIVGATGCRDRTAPSPAPPGSSSTSAFRPVDSPPSQSRPSPTEALAPLTPLPPASHPYTGGVWSSCADGYRVSDQPQKDVTRLSLVCAPYQGMQRHGRTWFGQVAKDHPGSFEAHLRKNRCGRVFAVSRKPLGRFRIEVSSPSGALVGVARSNGGFAIVNPKGAFCVEETGTYRTVVIGEDGSGMVAAELWTLPER